MLALATLDTGASRMVETGVQSIFRIESHELVAYMPERGIDPLSLVQPIDQLGLPAPGAVISMRVQAPEHWHWGTVEAAFLTRVIRHLDSAGEEIPVHGLPQGLQNLLELARRTTAHAAPPARRGLLLERTGRHAIERARSFKSFVTLTGEVALLIPKLFAGRAKVRGSEVLEVTAESSTRALFIVGVVNVLLGTILAFVGAVQLRAFGAGSTSPISSALRRCGS